MYLLSCVIKSMGIPLNKIRLEAYTERSESNPGRSLGIYEDAKKSCLEDSTLLIYISLVLSSRQPSIISLSIPRLRPGLLSLRSVLSSRQNCVSAISHFSLFPQQKNVTSDSSFFILHSSFKEFFIYNIPAYILIKSSPKTKRVSVPSNPRDL